MWQRIRFYVAFSVFDLCRLRSATVYQVVIVVGICLPVLLLMSLKRGEIAKLESDLTRDTAGRRVRIYLAAGDEAFRLSQLGPLQAQFGPVDLIIPDIRFRCAARTADQDAAAGWPITDLEIIPTSPGDPEVAGFGADVLRAGEAAVLLSQAAASILLVQEGDELELRVRRPNGDEQHLRQVIKRVIDTGDKSRRAFMNVDVLANIRRFQDGSHVPDWGWPAQRTEAKPLFRELLLIESRELPLNAEDWSRLTNRGIAVHPEGPDSSPQLTSLFVPAAFDKLAFWRLVRVDGAPFLASAFTDLSSGTDADDLLVPFPRPRSLSVDGRQLSVIPFTAPVLPRWAAKLLQPEVTSVDPTPDAMRLAVPFQVEGDSRGRLTLSDGATATIALFAAGAAPVPNPPSPPSSPPLTPPPVQQALPPQSSVLRPTDRPPSPAVPVRSVLTAGLPNSPLIASQLDSPTAGSPTLDPASGLPVTGIAPAALLSLLQQHGNQEVAYDSVLNLFVPLPRDVECEELFVYANSIYDVLEVRSRAEKMNFGYDCEERRIRDIVKQDARLTTIVTMVGGLVILFGILTVLFVLIDSTDSKRNAIGILMVMGASKFGIFTFVMLRAFLIAIIAGALAVTLNAGCCWLLTPRDLSVSASATPWYAQFSTWLPSVSAVANPFDATQVYLACLAFCSLGAIYPAWRATRCDPIVSVIEGKNQ